MNDRVRKLVDNAGPYVPQVIIEPIDQHPPHVPPPPMDWAKLALNRAPKRVWFDDQWLSPVPTLLPGPPGIGKTLLAQQWATHLAFARPLLSPYVHEQPLVTMMWGCEDETDELWRRQEDICEALGVGLDELAGKFHLVCRLGQENTLLAPVFGSLQRTSVYRELREQVNDLKADVLFLDNSAQTFGGNENDRHEVTVYANMLAGLVRGRMFCPVVLAHTPKSGAEFSGSTAWEAAVRMRLYFGDRLPDQRVEADEIPDNKQRFLCKRKANYTTKDYRRFQYKEGVFVPDAEEIEVGGGVVEVIRRGNAEKRVLEAVGWLKERNLPASHHQKSHRFLPKLMLEHELLHGLTKGDAGKALTRLVGDKRLLVDVPVGVNSSRHTIFGLGIPA